MKKYIFLAILMAVSLLPGKALAGDLENTLRENILLGAEDVVEDNYVRVGHNVTIDGDVHGDVIVIANSLTVNGSVSGDVLAAAATIRIRGPVAGNVRVAGNIIEIDNAIGKNLSVAGANVTITEKGSVGWSVAFGAADMTVRGPVAGGIHGYGNTVALASDIGTNANIQIIENGLLTIDNGAKIHGDVTYTGTQSALIKDGASVAGAVVHKLPQTKVTKARSFLNHSWLLFRVLGLLSFLLVGLVLVTLFPKQVIKITDAIWQRPWHTLLFGLLYLIVSPIVIALLFATIIGIPLAFVALMLYFVILYLAPIMTGTLIGGRLIGLAQNNKPSRLALAMFIGTTLVYLASTIPYIGWFLYLLAIVWAFGTLQKEPVSPTAATWKK